MTDNLFSNLTEYLSQLEARVARLEARDAALASALAAAETRLAQLEANHDMDDLLARIEDLENQEPLYAHVPEREVEVELVYDEDEAYDQEVEDESDEDEDVVLEPVAEPEPIAVPEPMPEPEPTPAPAPEPAPAPAPAPTTASVADTAAPKAGLAPRLEDLRKGISLGDRFLYQRELFAGNGELMTKTVALLNGMSSYEEADAYLKKNFQWNTESNAYELFYNLLHRRW